MKLIYKTQTTQAYWAGALTAKLHNTFYKRTDLPTIFESMKYFHALKTVFSKYYTLLTNNRFCYPFIIEYEKFNKTDLSKDKIGNHIDFILGYSDYIKRKRL